MKKFFAFFVALALMSVSIFSMAASAAAAPSSKSPSNWVPEYINEDTKWKPLDHLVFGDVGRLNFNGQLIPVYQPRTFNYAWVPKGQSEGWYFEPYGIFNHIVPNNVSVVSFGPWYVRFNNQATLLTYEIFGSSSLDKITGGSFSFDVPRNFRYGFSYAVWDGVPYLVLFISNDFDSISSQGYYSVACSQSFYSFGSGVYQTPLFNSASAIYGFNLTSTDFDVNTGYETDLPGGDTVNDVSVKSALICPQCGGKNVTLIPQPMYDVGSEGGLIYKIRCNDCQNYWHWTFTSLEKQIIEDLKNDPESGYHITYENAVSDNLGDIFDLPRDENGNVIWGDAAGRFGELMNGTFSGLSSAAVAVVSIFGTVFSFLPEGILALISFAIILCLFVGIFKTLRG